MSPITSLFKGMASAIGNVVTTMLGMLGAQGLSALIGKVADFARGAVETAGSVEALQLRLSVMLGSTEAASAAFDKFQSVAAKVPFSLEQVIQSGVQLQAFLTGTGFKAEDLSEGMADLAAFMGVDMTLASQSFGRAMAQGAGAADILRERGVLNVIRAFRDMRGEMKDITEISIEEFRRDLIDLVTNPTHGIAGMSDKLASTWGGVLSMLEDAMFELKRGIGDALLPTLKELVNETIIPAVKATSQWVKENQELIKTDFIEWLKRSVAIGKEMATWLGDVVGFVTKWTGIQAASRAVWEANESAIDTWGKTLVAGGATLEEFTTIMREKGVKGTNEMIQVMARAGVGAGKLTLEFKKAVRDMPDILDEQDVTAADRSQLDKLLGERAAFERKKLRIASEVQAQINALAGDGTAIYKVELEKQVGELKSKNVTEIDARRLAAAQREAVERKVTATIAGLRGDEEATFRLGLQKELADLGKQGVSKGLLKQYETARLTDFAKKQRQEEEKIRDDAMKQFQAETDARMKMGEDLLEFVTEGAKKADHEIRLIDGGYTEWVRRERQKRREAIEAEYGASESTARLFAAREKQVIRDAQADIAAAYGDTTAQAEVQVRKKFEAVLAATLDERTATAAAEAEKLRLSRGFFDGFSQGLIELRQRTSDFASISKGFIISAFDASRRFLSDGFFSALTGDFKALEKLPQQFANSMIRAFADMSAQLVTNTAFQFLFGTAGKTGGGGGSQVATFGGVLGGLGQMLGFGGGQGGGGFDFLKTGSSILGLFTGGVGGALLAGGLGLAGGFGLSKLFGGKDDPFKGTNMSGAITGQIQQAAANLLIAKGIAPDQARLNQIANEYFAFAGSDNMDLFGAFMASGRLNDLLRAKFPGFKRGGFFDVGGVGGPDSQLIAFLASPGERVSVRPPGGDHVAGGGSATYNVTVNVSGQNLSDPEAVARAVGREMRSELSRLDRRTLAPVQR
ncbi:MAG: hypothetical protein HYZ11_08230 [Candidatus Tectomicrobia bacterium]|uniref:Uncharacterized protein n=1 Tax=Tectimicrobiota bacterium TaxID=2528274 RepID=A0A932HXL6_UNCTE|nr:hypothetical protein [Candidatus Tectomicrobia bacterium]